MQALTVAIGPAGITYFAKAMLAAELINSLSRLRPPDKSIGVSDISLGQGATAAGIAIQLSEGKLIGYTPTFEGIAQRGGGQFDLTSSASGFSVSYTWRETYKLTKCVQVNQKFGPPIIYCADPEGHDVTFTYAPGVGKLLVDVLLKFDFDTTTQAWDVAVVSSSAIASAVAPNIPGESIIQKEDPGCFTSNVSDATATAVDSIDFASAISALIGPLLHSIPASGQLTPDIRYEFALGDSQLSFPGDQGIAVGVTGRVSYRGAYYPGTPPAALPVPPVPTAADTHHLQIYVSSYEWNALHWAFSQAGLLDVTVRPDDLPDPDVLKVKTYEVAIAAFKPYAPFAMTATVKPKRAPVASLREVYEFTQPVMQLLQQQLPTNIYQQIGGLDGNAYASREDLEADLSEAGVPPADSGIIEKAARSMGMAVTQDLEFTLTIENNAAPAPNLVFDVARTDILQGLALGVSGGGAQTLQYGFKPATGKTAATFVSTTVPHFDGGAFGAMIWPIVGEPNYDKLLADMGKTGVPLPIMQDFQFLFEQAQVSIQQDYVSVLAQVAFKGTSAA